MSTPTTPTAAATLTSVLADLESKISAAWNAVEGGVVQFFDTMIPVLESDVEAALSLVDQAFLQDAITAITGFAIQGNPISSVADNFIQAAEIQGKTIATNVAVVAAGQVVAKLQTSLGAIKASAPAAAPATP